MKIELRSQSLQLTTALEQYADKRARAALDRFADQIRTVTLRVDDLNGPKGGVDKVCRARVRGAGFDLMVEHRHADADLAVGAALSRMSRVVARHLDARALRPRRSVQLAQETP
jgi:putative sigma-54 modulation protein